MNSGDRIQRRTRAPVSEWRLSGFLVLHGCEGFGIASLLTDTERLHYHTLGGLAMAALGRVPRVGDVFERRRARFEIVDMDGNRVDRVLVALPTKGSAEQPHQ